MRNVGRKYDDAAGPIPSFTSVGQDGVFTIGLEVTDAFRNTGYFNDLLTSIRVPFEDPTIDTPVTCVPVMP